MNDTSKLSERVSSRLGIRRVEINLRYAGLAALAILVFALGVLVETIGARMDPSIWQHLVETGGALLWFSPVPILIAIGGTAKRSNIKPYRRAERIGYLFSGILIAVAVPLLFSDGYLAGGILLVASCLPASIGVANARSARGHYNRRLRQSD